MNVCMPSKPKTLKKEGSAQKPGSTGENQVLLISRLLKLGMLRHVVNAHSFACFVIKLRGFGAS